MTKNNTIVQKVNNVTSIKLHSTKICEIEDVGNSRWQVTLNSGGWMTSTTKKRMNEAARDYCCRYFMVYQKAGSWIVRFLTTEKASFETPPQNDDPFGDNEEIPELDSTFVGWKELPFVDGMTFKVGNYTDN